MQSHAFSTPTDKQCLSCHYGNYVGGDYYGRYEHDFTGNTAPPTPPKLARTLFPPLRG